MAEKKRSLKNIKPNVQNLLKNVDLGFNTKEERANLPGGANMPYDPRSGTYVKVGEAEPYVQPPPAPKAPEAPTKYIYEGVDISKPFSSSDFATPELYEQAKRRAFNSTTSTGSTEQLMAEQQAQFEAQQLAGQVGQFGQMGIEPTGLNMGEAATSGIVGAIPRALSYAATGFAVGGAAGTKVSGTPITAAGGAVIGAVGGFVSGLASSIIGNFKSQRTDTTNAQKRVLDEGKQNLNDWATLAASDPANRSLYVANFNQQLALIDQAYRQMKLDTSRDVAKFETALPDLAEFEAFYMAQGERDFLVTRMYQSLGVMQDPDYSYQMQELANRRLSQ